jgi:hypothetical protein
MTMMMLALPSLPPVALPRLRAPARFLRRPQLLTRLSPGCR